MESDRVALQQVNRITLSRGNLQFCSSDAAVLSRLCCACRPTQTTPTRRWSVVRRSATGPWTTEPTSASRCPLPPTAWTGCTCERDASQSLHARRRLQNLRTAAGSSCAFDVAGDTLANYARQQLPLSERRGITQNGQIHRRRAASTVRSAGTEKWTTTTVDQTPPSPERRRRRPGSRQHRSLSAACLLNRSVPFRSHNATAAGGEHRRRRVEWDSYWRHSDGRTTEMMIARLFARAAARPMCARRQ